MKVTPRRGLTLIELLVVIALIGLLIALLLPAVQEARRSSARIQCVNNLRQVGLALQSYEGANSQFPTGQLLINNGPYGIYCRSVFVSVLPYLDQTVLYNGFNLSIGATDLPNITVDLGRPSVFLCPADPAASSIVSAGPEARRPAIDPSNGTYPAALTSYGMVHGSVELEWDIYHTPSRNPLGQINGVFNDRQSVTAASVFDGLSQTAFASERAIGPLNRDMEFPLGWWVTSWGPGTILFMMYPPNYALKIRTIPNQVPPGGRGFSSLHRGGVNVLFGDASVRFVKDSVDSWAIDPVSDLPAGSTHSPFGLNTPPPNGVWQSIATCAGSEVVSSDGL